MTDEDFDWSSLGPDKVRVRTYYGAEREEWRHSYGRAHRLEDRRYCGKGLRERKGWRR